MARDINGGGRGKKPEKRVAYGKKGTWTGSGTREKKGRIQMEPRSLTPSLGVHEDVEVQQWGDSARFRGRGKGWSLGGGGHLPVRIIVREGRGE